MKNYKFSILIPCYGEAKYLRRTLKSILSQTYTNFEIIICKQGNTEIDKDLLCDQRIRVIYLEQPSPYLSRIDLYNKATGDYVWFVDDDDEICDDSLSLINEVLQLNVVDCLIFKKNDVGVDIKEPLPVKPVYNDGLIESCSKQKAFDELLTTNNFNSVCCKIFKSNLHPDWIKTNIYQSEDKLLNYALYKTAQSFLKINIPLYKYFVYHGFWSQPTTLSRLNDSIEARKLLANREPMYVRPLVIDILNRIISYIFVNSSNECDFNISFDADEYEIKKIIKDTSFKRKIIYNLAIKKRYKILRMIGKFYSFIRTKKRISIPKLRTDFKGLKKSYYLLIPFVCFTLVSPIMTLSKSSEIQDIANTITKYAKNEGNKLISFGKKDLSSGARPSFSSEYYAMKDQFHSYSYCLETYDPLKEKDLRIVSFCEEFDGDYQPINTELSNNLSFLTSPGIQIETTYTKDDSSQEIYKNIFYEFEFKYKGLEKGDSSETHFPIFCALHQNQTDELIEIINSVRETKIGEEELIGKYIGICSSDSQENFVFRIFNVIKSNSETLSDYDSALGNFIFVNDYMFGDKELNNSYMMSVNEYENYYNLKTRLNAYQEINYKIMFGNSCSPSPQDSTIQSRLNNIMDNDSSKTTTMIILLFLDFIGFAVFAFLCRSKRIIKSYSILILGIILPVVPYLLFKVIVSIAKSFLLYSYVTGLVYLGFVIVYEIYFTYLLIRLIHDNKK